MTAPTSPPTPENPHAGEGMVVLDIGGDVGALLVSAPSDLDGAEIEICPSGRRGGAPDDGGDWWIGEWHAHGHDAAHEHSHDGDHEHSHDDSHEHSHDGDAHSHGMAWPHVSILARRVTGGHSAIFPGLREGHYDLWLRPDGPTALSVDVVGSQVTSVDWPSAT
jgi:hypothetical protein